MKIINQSLINSFVTAVETKKGFARNPDKVFRHIVSELGELDAAMYAREQLVVSHQRLSPLPNDAIGDELLDIIFLACYMADLYAVDLNALARPRMAAIQKQYGVVWKPRAIRSPRVIQRPRVIKSPRGIKNPTRDKNPIDNKNKDIKSIKVTGPAYQGVIHG